MATETKIEGLAELDRMLKELPAVVEGRVMRGALTAGQRVIANAAKDNLTNEGAIDSGALRKSIRVRFLNKSKKYGWIRTEAVAGNKEAWYAHIIEFGSGSFYEGNGTKSKRQPYEINPRKKDGALAFQAGGFDEAVVKSVTHPGVKPRAFMRNAVDGSQSAAIDKVVDYIRTRLPKEVEKLKK